MLKIQVLGKGMIPRGLGLAPRYEPFPADLTLINTILNAPGLSVNMLNPDTKRFVQLTKQNVHRMWNSYSHKVVNESKEPQTTPHVPEPEKKPEDKKPEPQILNTRVPQTPKPAEPVVITNVNEKKDNTSEEDHKSDEKKPEDKKPEQKPTTFAPINAPEQQGNNNKKNGGK